MSGERDDEKQPGQDHVERQHDLPFQQTPRPCRQNEGREQSDDEDVAGDLGYQHGDDEEQVGTLQRDEDSERASGDREQSVWAMLGLKVVILASPRETCERDAPQQDHLEHGECYEGRDADDGDDLGHAITVAGGD
jgi:hypothetical protein